MPSIPLVTELGSKSDEFQALLNASPIPSSVSSTLLPMASPNDMFTLADSRIFVRSRPVIAFDKQPMQDVGIVQKVDGYKDAVLMAPKVSLSGRCSIEPSRVVLDGVFVGSEDSTEFIYESSCAPLLALSGGGASTCVICYGQTGSGKTFTTSGLMRLFAADIEPYLATHDVSLVVVEVQSSANIDLLSGAPIQIGEDVQGEIKLLGAVEHPIVSRQSFLALVASAAAARSTKATGRNEQSSRSHMIARVRFTPKGSSWARPGFLFVADLAGSESTADSATHDKTRQMEAKFINSSLMTLKDCIRARAAGGTSTQGKHLHIPFRRSPLTMLLRDCFELAVRRPTKTVVIACVSPLLRDARHTINTLRYASLLAVTPPSVVVALDADDPSGWDRPTALAFLTAVSKGRVTKPELILTEGDGRALVHIPEADFISRVVASHPAIPEKGAQMIYSQVWKAVVDARTKTRKALKGDPKNAFRQKEELSAPEEKEKERQQHQPPPPPSLTRQHQHATASSRLQATGHQQQQQHLFGGANAKLTSTSELSEHEHQPLRVRGLVAPSARASSSFTSTGAPTNTASSAYAGRTSAAPISSSSSSSASRFGIGGSLYHQRAPPSATAATTAASTPTTTTTTTTTTLTTATSHPLTPRAGRAPNHPVHQLASASTPRSTATTATTTTRGLGPSSFSTSYQDDDDDDHPSPSAAAVGPKHTRRAPTYSPAPSTTSARLNINHNNTNHSINSERPTASSAKKVPVKRPQPENWRAEREAGWLIE